jgi:hypothetical protein
MMAILHSLAMFVIDLFKSPRRLEAEDRFLRHQLSIALRRAPPRLRLRGSDRALMVWLTRLWPSLLDAAHVVQPETILRWHRAGFTAFWRWKSRRRGGRPKIDRELRDLIRRSKENPKWGASRIHGELLVLGFEVAQSTVSKYMVRGGSPSQGWKTFFRNHAHAIAAIDLLVVPTLTFERLFTHPLYQSRARESYSGCEGEIPTEEHRQDRRRGLRPATERAAFQGGRAEAKETDWQPRFRQKENRKVLISTAQRPQFGLPPCRFARGLNQYGERPDT